jgi:hypothetical protein
MLSFKLSSGMTYRGHIRNGVVVFEAGAPVLPDRTPVRVEVDRLERAFWEGKSLEELAREQGVKPATSKNGLVGEWPENESVDDFLALIRGARVP